MTHVSLDICSLVTLLDLLARPPDTLNLLNINLLFVSTEHDPPYAPLIPR